MAEKKKGEVGIHTSTIIEEANLDECDTKYSNHAQFAFANNELFLDFYLIEPAKHKYSDKPKATLVSRLAIPKGMAKGLATALANVIHSHEKITGTKLLNQRGKHPSDEIEIWSD